MNRHLALALLVLSVLVMGTRGARAASDPSLAYHTLQSKHFRITYHTGCEEVARRVADVAESIHRNMVQHVGWEPREITEIFLSDLTDTANGSASAVPYNAIRLNVTAPDDLSPLGDVDDWYTELVTHEYTHILHVDQIRGVPAIVNAVIGKTYAPNQIQPRWFLEGLATYHESARTSGGRLRSSIWDMYMRADILENNVATLDQMSNYVRRWPQGNIWYLYGSYFLDWIARTYGEEALRFVADDYGSRVIPWGINRSIRRATGSTYEELFPRWIAAMRAKYGGQLAVVASDGRVEGKQITFNGQNAAHPRFRTRAGQDELVYYNDNGHDRAGFFTVPWKRDASGNFVMTDRDRTLLARTNGEGYGEFGPDGTFFFSSIDTKLQLLPFYDLFALDPGETSQQGNEPERIRLTEGARAVEPTISPDGSHLAFVENKSGTRRLFLADVVVTSGKPILKNSRLLVPAKRFEQSYTPRFSPDGNHVAYSVWRHGGYRDIRVVDIRNGTFHELSHDRAQEGDPVFSSDGKHIYFHSDRSGIFNVYAWSIEEKVLYRVTNVNIGAFQPEPSPDGKTLVYLGYTSRGFDLFSMPLDPASWKRAAPYIDTHPDPPQIGETGPLRVDPYQPLRTLFPRAYSVKTEPGNFGQRFSVSAVGSDLAELHGVSATLYTEVERPEIQGSVSYSYGRLPVDLGLSLSRSIAPRGGFSLGGKATPVVQESTSIVTSVGYPIIHAFDSQNIGLSYSLNRVGIDLPFDSLALDPYETPRVPFRGFVGALSFGYSFSNVERYLWSIGGERGFSFSANVSTTQPWLASDFSGIAATSDLTAYFRMPWLQNHTLALHAGAGFSGGSFPGRGSFFIGSFVELPLVDVLRNVLLQGGYVLRGYSQVAASGSQYGLVNAEYRFPIVNIDRGLSTLPVFLNRVNGAVFADYGTAFDDPNTLRFKLGTGAEITIDTLLGYYALFTFKAGFAHGFHSGGMDKLYFVAAVPY